jgi:hypothetical protein
MANNEFYTSSPFDSFPYNTFLQVIDKMIYLGEESSPYEVSPGTDLCISDTYYSLGFLTYLHSFGRVIQENERWVFKPKGEIIAKEPYRFKLIAEAVSILQALRDGYSTVEAIHNAVGDIQKAKIEKYLRILILISQRGKIEQLSKGWDATFIIKDWE